MNTNIKSAAPQLLFGLCVLLLGCLFLLENFGYVTFHLWDYWPALFVVIGVGRLIQAESSPGRVVAVFFVAGGLLWILYNIGVIDAAPWQLWPLALIVAGGALIWRTIERGGQRPKPVPASAPTPGGDVLNMAAFLGGFQRSLSSQDFRGGSLTAFMGGCEVDLRDASISASPAVIDVFAFWGGIEMRVPDDWTVEIRAFPMLGGIDCKARTPDNDTKRLVIKGMTIMGGLEVRN
jgi:predicted membrane protein